jgi:hypothetical protein
LCLEPPQFITGLPSSLTAPADTPTEVAVGDWALVHAGFPLARIHEEEAQRTLAWLEGMGQAYADELQSFEASRIRASEHRTAR